MAAGKIVKFDKQKGYGFIRPAAGGHDIFLHVAEVRNQDVTALRLGCSVTYTSAQGERGPKAVDVEIATGDDDMSDVLTREEYGTEVGKIMGRAASDLQRLAHDHGWTDGEEDT